MACHISNIPSQSTHSPRPNKNESTPKEHVTNNSFCNMLLGTIFKKKPKRINNEQRTQTNTAEN